MKFLYLCTKKDMAEERLVESIKLLPWPNSCFNWYEIVPKWFGSTTYRYEILIRNSNVYVTTISNVGENPVNQKLRERILSVCNFINETGLSEVSSKIKPLLTDSKVIQAVNLFKGLTLLETRSWKPTDYMEFKMLINNGGYKPRSINGSDPFWINSISLNGRTFFYKVKYINRVGEFNELYVFDNCYQREAVLILVRAAMLCTIEEHGEFGKIHFTDVPNLIDKAIKYGLLRFM